MPRMLGRGTRAVHAEGARILFGNSEGCPHVPTRKTAAYRLDPFDLRLFIAVLELGTITAAAAAMNLSLAAASARLKALDDRVGVPLLDRAKAGSTPTAAGRALARHAQRVLGEVEALHTEMSRFGAGLRGTLRVAGNTAAGALLLPALLGSFLVRHPDIDVELQELPSDAVLDALHRRAVDVGLVADHVDTGGLHVQPLGEDRLCAALPAKGAGRRRSLRFADLLDRPFVGLAADAGLSRFLQQVAARTGRVPRHRVRVRGLEAVMQLVDAGVGVAVVPAAAAQRFAGAATRLLPLADPWALRRLLACAQPDARHAPGVRDLLAFLAAHAPGA
jgi:DNA-binding transcriptional LysR family regulator